MRAPRILIGATGSGSGKTTITCALLEILKRQGKKVQAFKCGPDYIDPMFHRTVLGIPSKNLDTFFTGDKTTAELFMTSAKNADISVMEGVMGLYDGFGGMSIFRQKIFVRHGKESYYHSQVWAARYSTQTL